MWLNLDDGMSMTLSLPPSAQPLSLYALSLWLLVVHSSHVEMLMFTSKSKPLAVSSLFHAPGSMLNDLWADLLWPLLK